MLQIFNRKPIYIAIIIISILLCYLAFEGYISLQQYRIYNDILIREQKIITSNSQLLSYLREARKNQRNYLNTGKTEFFQAYYQIKVSYKKKFHELKEMTGENKGQQVKLDTIAKLVAIRFNRLDSSISVKIKAGSHYIEPAFNPRRGNSLMDSIRNISNAFSNDEQILLNRQQRVSYDNVRKTQIFFYLSVSITLCSLIILFYYLLSQLNTTIKIQGELYNKNQWFTQTLGSLGDGVIATDPNHRITYMNKEAEKLTLYKQSEAISLLIEDVINLKDETTEKAIMVPTRQAITDKCIVGLGHNTILIRKDTSQFYIENSSAPVYDITGDLLGAVLIFRDITEQTIINKKIKQLNEGLEVLVMERTQELLQEITVRKRAEVEKGKLINNLIEINKALEQFIYIVSHNFRRPVANIMGLLNIIQMEPVNHDSKTTFDYLSTEINALDTVLQDLGTITDIRKNQSDNKEPILVLEVLSTIINSLNYEIIKVGAIMTIDISPQNTVLGIKSYLHSILINLISNAIKYRDPELKLIIKFGFQSTDTHTIITIKDNGLGIDLDKHGEKLFGLYNRFHDKIEGKGIGLHITKTQMEMLGGFIEVKSAIGNGTEFMLHFPKKVVDL
jgi:PAS domain S-box-containing protein